MNDVCVLSKPKTDNKCFSVIIPHQGY